MFMLRAVLRFADCHEDHRVRFAARVPININLLLSCCFFNAPRPSLVPLSLRYSIAQEAGKTGR